MARNWNYVGKQRLQEQRRLEEDYERFCRTQPVALSAVEQERIRSLASAIPELWHAETTTPADRQRLVRFLIERIVVDVQGTSERVTLTIHWMGGFSSCHELGARSNVTSNWPTIRVCVRGSRTACSRNDHGSGSRVLEPRRVPTPEAGQAIHQRMVAGFLAKGGRSGPRPRALAASGLLRKKEWLLSDLARKLGMPPATMHRWRKAGWVHAPEVARARWPLGHLGG